jgi:hypothetical protein
MKRNCCTMLDLRTEGRIGGGGANSTKDLSPARSRGVCLQRALYVSGDEFVRVVKG